MIAIILPLILIHSEIPQSPADISSTLSKVDIPKFDLPGQAVYSQEMAEVSQGTNKQSTAAIEGLNIPSVFAIELQGETEASPFSALAATLEIQPASPGDPNPFLITCYMSATKDEELVNGSLFWQSYIPEHPRRDEQYSRITVMGNQVRMEVAPSNVLRSDVMWFTTSMGVLPIDIAGETRQMSRIGAMGMTGTLTFSIQENQISGEIQISGMSDLDTPSTYRATFTGNRVNP
jgi:hypothetical protein